MKHGDIIAITELVQGDKPTASIEKTQLTETITSIKMEIEVANVENATYRYFYKEETGEYQKVYEGKEQNFTIDRLKSGTNYWIKVEVTDNEQTTSKEVLVKTKGIKKGQESVADLSKIGEYNDNFAMIAFNTSIDNLGTITEELFIQAVKNDGSIKEENIMINNNGNYQMVTNEGYVYEVVLKSENNVGATYIGTVEN